MPKIGKKFKLFISVEFHNEFAKLKRSQKQSLFIFGDMSVKKKSEHDFIDFKSFKLFFFNVIKYFNA